MSGGGYSIFEINSHPSRLPISDQSEREICAIGGVEKTVRVGTYGMELWVIYDRDEISEGMLRVMVGKCF